jgi:hypothetical protein
MYVVIWPVSELKPGMRMVLPSEYEFVTVVRTTSWNNRTFVTYTCQSGRKDTVHFSPNAKVQVVTEAAKPARSSIWEE